MNASSPRGSGGRPEKILRPPRATGAIYATTAGLFFGSHFWGFLTAPTSWNFVYALILAIRQNFVEDRMSKYDLEKKLQHSEIREIGQLCAISLTDWLSDHWPLPHFSRQDSSPSFSPTPTCLILKNEAFLESLQHGQCGIAKIWDPTSLEF